MVAAVRPGAGHRGRCPGGCGPDAADALAVRCHFWNCGRSGWLVCVRAVGVHRGHFRSLWRPQLQKAVVPSASVGRLPPLPVGVGELALQPVAELGAYVGHRRSLQGQGLLGG